MSGHALQAPFSIAVQAIGKDNLTFPIYLHENSIQKLLEINPADLYHLPAVVLEAGEGCSGFTASTFLCSHLSLQL